MSTKRNSSGDLVKFNYYTDYTKEKNLYAMTSSIHQQQQRNEIKHNNDILPIDRESLNIWLKRTIKSSMDLTEYSRNQHIHGTTKTWACHTSSRYCFICTLCDFVDILRIMAHGLEDLGTSMQWSISVDEDGETRYQLIST